MLRNYLIIAYRNLLRHLAFSLINIVGLAFGLTCFLVIALYVWDELQFDAFHAHADQIYRVVETKVSEEGNQSRLAATAYNISAAAEKSLPEVVNACRILGGGRMNMVNPQNSNTFHEEFWVSDPGFLNMFSFPMLEGDRRSALSEPYSVVLTQQMAQKLFGDKAVLGEFIQANAFDTPFKVTGILKNFPANSHLDFNLIFSESTLATDSSYRTFRTSDWNSNQFITYLQLAEGASVQQVAGKLAHLAAANRKDQPAHSGIFMLQPLKDIHFYSAGIEGGLAKRGEIFYVYVFTLVAFFVLFIACINYINLATARSASRAKEVGIRKTVGARWSHLVSQFLSETLLITCIAFLLAVTAVQLILPAINIFTGKELSLGLTSDYRSWLALIGLALVVSILSGSYPAFYLSRYQPYRVLKGMRTNEKGNLGIRRSLVVFQFTLSIIMITATFLVYLQLEYVRNKNLGFDKEQLLVVDINSGAVRRGYATIKSEYAKLASVKTVSVSSRVPGEWKNLPRVTVLPAGSTQEHGADMYFLGIDDSFLETFEVSLLQGRNFNSSSASDSTAILINETAAKTLGISEASGQWIEIPSVTFGGVSRLDKPFRARVIGITKDFHFQSLRETIAPLVMAYHNNPIHSIDYFTVRITGAEVPATLKQMEAILQSVDASHMLEYHFLDQQLDLFYQEDLERERIFIAAAIMTILIACLGLFGLAAFTAQQRTKEIGIRKVLGASVGTIVALLSKDFLKLVLIAFAIATPIAWYFIHTWLADFAYHITLSWWMFAIAGLAALGIAFLTVSYQSIKLPGPTPWMRSGVSK